MNDELTEDAPVTCKWIGGCNEEPNESGWCDPHEEQAEALRQRREQDKAIASEAMAQSFEAGETRAPAPEDSEAVEQERRDSVVQTINDRDLPPIPSRIVWYETDRRNGLAYYLPAMVTVTADSHPGDYPDGSANPLPVPDDEMHVHLTVFTPGGFGTKVVVEDEGPDAEYEPDDDSDFVGAERFVPGSGTYVELNVPFDPEGGPRTWRWPEIR